MHQKQKAELAAIKAKLQILQQAAQKVRMNIFPDLKTQDKMELPTPQKLSVFAFSALISIIPLALSLIGVVFSGWTNMWMGLPGLLVAGAQGLPHLARTWGYCPWCAPALALLYNLEEKCHSHAGENIFYVFGPKNTKIGGPDMEPDTEYYLVRRNKNEKPHTRDPDLLTANVKYLYYYKVEVYGSEQEAKEALAIYKRVMLMK